MCGICGVINISRKPVPEFTIRRMMEKMKHRGPDDEGIFLESNIGLGFVRLSIIDLSSAGHQPMFSADERYVIVFNGEIFNYIELRKILEARSYKFKTSTDTEVLLYSYVEWGENCLHMLNGMWAFAIFDRLENSLIISRDRYGIKPLYYYQDTEKFVFASEIGPILKVLGKNPEPNLQSVFDYMVFNRTDQTLNTFFKDVYKLQHGYCIKINTKEFPDKTNIRKWYDLRKQVEKATGFNSPAELRELLTDSLNLRLRSDVPLGVCFSGGLDSSTIVSIILKDFKLNELNTFSAVYGKGQTGDESEYINEYVPDLKNMHFITPDASTLQNDIYSFITAHSEPVPSTSPYAQFKVMEVASKKVVVTLDGQGADEMFGGYHYFYGFLYKELLKSWRIPKLAKELALYIIKQRSSFGIKTFMFFLLPSILRTSARVNEKGYFKPGFVNTFSSINNVSENIYGSKNLRESLLDHFEYKLEHLLKWEDRNSMWFSMEARVPFLDHRLVEKTFATAGDIFIKNGMTKAILRDSIRGLVPEKIRLRRDKVGFGTPQEQWFRDKNLINLAKGILDTDSFLTANIVEKAKAMNCIDLHLAGKKDYSREIWKWINLELWHRQFISESKIKY